MMETCGKCLYLINVGDPKEPMNECHRFPPQAAGKGAAVYPIVKNIDPGCGDWTSKEMPEKEPGPAAQTTKTREKIDKARGKALKR